MFTTEQVNQYIKSKQGSWAATSTRSESSRLHTILAFLSMTDAEKLYSQLAAAGKLPYTIKTTFIRVGDFFEYCYPSHPNPYKDLLKRDSKRFKNAYIPERLAVNFNDAKEKISEMKDERCRKLAYFILHSGLRAREALSYSGSDSGWVMGKGARMRRVFNSELAPVRNEGVTYLTFYRSLRAVGLKPHTLRKLAATEMAKGGLKEADLLHVMGWSSMQTASIYLQPTNDAALESRLQQIMCLNTQK